MTLAVATEGEGPRLRAQLAEAWAEIKTLRRTVAHQARLISHLESETSPSAPSVNCVYWLFAAGRYHEPSWRWHWNRLRPFIDDLGTMPAIEVTPVVWERHLVARRNTPDRHGNAPCAHTLNIELARAKSMLDWAVVNQMIAYNPLKAARYAKTVSQRETKLGQLDIERLLLEAESLRDRRLPEEDDDGRRAAMLRAFVLLCFDSMLRFNEARHVRRDLIQANGDYQFNARETKGRRQRVVTFTPRTLEAIAAVPAHPDTNELFVNAAGKLLGETTMRMWFRWACERGRLDARAAPGERIVPHHLRHAGATEADAAGARPTALRDALGHTKMATTERYLHAEKAEGARHVAERMSAAALAALGPARRASKRAPRASK